MYNDYVRTKVRHSKNMKVYSCDSDFYKEVKIINVHNPVTDQDSGVKPRNNLIA